MMRKSKIDRNKLIQIFCVYILALVASIAAGENMTAKSTKANTQTEAHGTSSPSNTIVHNIEM
jgi:hypothetical protein